MTRIAFWGDVGWALGRIGNAIRKYSGHTVDMYDWSKLEESDRLFLQKWQEYDLIIVPTALTDYDPGASLCPEVYKRMLIVAHCPIFNHSHFRETVCIRPGASYAGVSIETCREMERHGMGPARWLPFGADTDEFPIRHTVSGPIRRIGIVAKPYGSEAYMDVKGTREFDTICERLGVEPVYIHGTNDPYKDIDLLVCCSRFEAGPLGIFEAAACGVPVLTRPVGNAQRIKGIRTFDTVDDAVAQIRRWNGHIRSLTDYGHELTQEVRTNWSMEKLIQAVVLK